MCGAGLRKDRPPSRLQHPMHLPQHRCVGGKVMKSIQTEHAIEAGICEGEGLPSRHDEAGFVAEHESAVMRETLPASPHHFERQVHGNGAYAKAAEEFRRPTGAGCEVQHAVVGTWSQQAAGNRQLKQVLPDVLGGGPVKGKVQAGGNVLPFVSERFQKVRLSIDRWDPSVFPGEQFFGGHGREALLASNDGKPKRLPRGSRRRTRRRGTRLLRSWSRQKQTAHAETHDIEYAHAPYFNRSGISAIT